MASTEVIREYLTKIGYVTDAVSAKKAEAGIVGFGKKVMAVGGAVAGLVASVGAATAAFAYSMRKMYYQSELSQSSVKNIKGIGYAFESIGGAEGQIEGVVKNLAQILRMNPGMKALAESLGVKTTGRDMSNVAMDLVKSLSKMPHEYGAKFAEQFGMDEETFFMVKKHMGEISAKRKEMAGMYKEMGVDPDASKKMLMEYTNELGKLENRLSLLGQKALIAFANPFKEAVKWSNELISGWSNFLGSIEKGKAAEDFNIFVESASKDVLSGWRKATGLSYVYDLMAETPEETKRRNTPFVDRVSSANITKSYTESTKAKDKTGFTAPVGAAAPVGKLGATLSAYGIGDAKLGAGSNNVTISQTNHVTVTEAQNAKETGKVVSEAISKPLGLAFRNARGASLP